MESGNGGASSKGVLVPVSESSSVFQSDILTPLKSAYLYEESKQSFRYTSAALVKNPALEEKYYAFRAKRKEAGYSDEDLCERYGFLLFDDVNKANALAETGVLTGNSTCTTLGDPSKGVCISMYSDCLDLNRWYHGKSGYIAIIRLTKGKVKKVSENYTQNFTAPTVGFDCHVSEQLPSVSANTSSFLAFERTQYYMYELLDDGSNETSQSPSAACPFAIVSFSYTDTKATLVAPQKKSEEKKLVRHYFPWRGQLQIGTQFYDVGLRSTAGALIPAGLPPVVKIDRAISMLDLRQLLPKAVFETCFSGEVLLDGLYCSLCELVSSEAEETNSLSLVLQEIKEKDLALTIQLSDGGFLILLHSSHFLTYDDTGSSSTDVLQGMFVFPDSQVIQRDTKMRPKKPAMSSEVLQVLPVLSYAEGEVEKSPVDPGEDLCEVFVQHMQNYAALINPGLALSPSREASIFPDQYDVPDAHKHLYSCPEWTNRAWQSFRSYLSKPVSFQLPVSKVSEILVAGQEERIEDLDDDVYICLSSPEETPANPVSIESEDQLTSQRSPVNVETPMDSCLRSAEAEVDLEAAPQNVVPDDLQAGDATKDTCKSDLTVLIKTDDKGAKHLLTHSTSDDLPTELIVSITSAERTVTDESISMISTVSATKHNDFQLSGFSAAKLQMAGVNSLNDETVTTKKVLDCPEVTSLSKIKRRKLRRAHFKSRKRVSKACVETPILQIPVEDDNLKSQKEGQAKEPSGHPDGRKVPGRKCKFQKLSSKNEEVTSASVGLAVEKKSDPGLQSLESTILMELEAFPLRKKTERWDLKPVVSECGRILVPHGSVDYADQIKSLKDKFQSTKDEQCPEKMLIGASVNAHETVEMEQESSTAPETTVDKTEATTSKDGENHLQNVSDVNPEHSILRQSDDGNGSLTSSREHSSKTDGTATPPSEAVQEKHNDTLSPGKFATKGEILLSKLKSVLLRGKRKTDLLVAEQMAANTDAEPCLKKGKVDSDTGMRKTNYAITSFQDTNVGVKEVSKMLSVDPLFAYALGLTPKETLDKTQKTEGQDDQQRKDSSETQEHTILDKQTRILQRPPSIFPRRGRIKMLKKHQGMSEEHVKKKWWLHFQTPACFASEKLKYKECTRDNSVRKTVKEKMNSACSSTDALNLLADLALSANNDQVPPQPDAALERKPETSLKKCDLTKDVTSAEQESVLHALLRQPAARPMQPPESPSPSHLVGGSELVALVSKEHAYSLPPSSSLLLGLPGTPFQVSPLSGSTRLLHHHQTKYGDGIKTLHPCVGQEGRSEPNHRTPEYLRKQMARRRKFRHCRTFVDKDGSIQVTKQWRENYDFNLDSKFTSDPMDRTIVRALHGPWDFSMQDTAEEVRLIVHMWIGLFYSRSTARLFHVDPYPEESNSLEPSSGTVSAPAQSELNANSFATFLSVMDTSDPSISKALDLSRKDDVILDLSLRNSNAKIVTSDPQVNRKETSVTGDQKEASETLNTVKSPVGVQEENTIQCYKKTVHSTEITNEVNDVRSTYENKTTDTPLQKPGSMESTDVPKPGSLENTDVPKPGSLENTDVPSIKSDGTFILVQEEMEIVSVQPENSQTVSEIGHVSNGRDNKDPDLKDSVEDSEATEMTSVQKHRSESSKSVTDEEVDSNKEASDVVHTVEHNEMKCKDSENLQVKEKPCQESNGDPSPKVTNTSDDPTNRESPVVCNGLLAENVDYCPEQKDEHHFGKEDELDAKDNSVSPMEADSDLSDQPVPILCDGPDSAKTDRITDCNLKPPLDEQPSQANNEEDACHDLQLRKLCANGSALTDEQAISEKSPQTPSEMEPILNETAVEENSKNDICLADEAVTDEQAISEKSPQTPSEMEPILNETAVEENSKNDICLADEAVTDEQAISEKSPQTPSEMEPILNETAGEENSKNDICLADEAVADEQTISEKSPQTPSEMEPILNETAVEENSKNDICLADEAVTDEQAISEKSPQTPSEMEPILNETAVEENSKNDICLADEAVADEQAISEKSPQTPSEMEPILNETAVEENSKNDICLADEAVTDEQAISEKSPQTPSEMEPILNETAVEENSKNDICLADEAVTDEQAISEKSPQTPSEMEPILNETAVEENSKNDICLADEAHYQKAAMPMSDNNNCSLDGSCIEGSIPNTHDSVETGNQSNVLPNFNLTSDGPKDGDTQSVEGEQTVDNATGKELFQHQSEAEVFLDKEIDLKQFDKTNERLEKIHSRVEIPFIGTDISGEDIVLSHVSHSHGKVEEVVPSQEVIPFISENIYPETAPPTAVCSQLYSKKAELSACKTSLLDVSENNHPVFSGSESDDRCSTPTMDEKPYEYLTRPGPSGPGASAFSGGETNKNMTQKCLYKSSTSTKEEVLLEHKLGHESTVYSSAKPHRDLRPDLEMRTLRVLQSIGKFLSKSSHADTSSQIETAHMKHSLALTPNPSSQYIPCLAPGHISAVSVGNKISNITPAVVSASTSQERHTESTVPFLTSPFKSKLEEVLGVKLQLKKTDSSVHQHYFERTDKVQDTSVGQDYCHPYRSVPSTSSLHAIKPNIDQDRHKTAIPQTNLSHEPCSYSQRPVMAVKPSKSDESQADILSKVSQIENAVMSHFSKNKQTKTPSVTYTTPTTMLLEKKTKRHKIHSERLHDDKQGASELSQSSWLSNVSDSKSNSDKAESVILEPRYQHQRRDISNFNKIPSSSLPVQYSESASSSKRVDGNQGFKTYRSIERVGQTTKESIEMDQKDCSDASTSRADYKDGGIRDDSLFLEPQSSLMCTVYNTSKKRSYSFLEHVSQRCLQDDITVASMEQECLIFSEQMKHLLKRSKRGPIMDTHDKLHLSCASPVMVHFSGLEDQEDSVDHLDAPSLVGQKIKVDMSDRKDQADATMEGKTLNPQKSYQGTGNPMEHAGVSGMTSEFARRYEAMMNDVCAFKKVPSRPKHIRMDRGHPKTESSNHFDFCDQMKREMDESFRSKLNSVVKKSCKTKYRFYILVTSDDAFFEETKTQLEAEGHIAVQPSEFFHGEDSSASLLIIIIRNEDIAEHICEVPYLLQLKNSPGVQFAGIDEPDDFVNLTHQELLTRGGFIVFDRAALESLSLCNMKKMSEVLQELSRTGKWKWMLHYRDSRRLKENARLNAEAKEKKQFLNVCQEAGILEVLPYHECDLMSRDQPDYLTCLVRLQVQNISARYPVFITDATTDSTFGKNGILTMTFSSFLTCSPSETFTVTT